MFSISSYSSCDKNKGIKNLTQCTIEWSKNNTFQPSYQWSGNLPEDFTDTITIGTYTPIFDTTDNFKIWVSLPNGQIDFVNEDDTLQQSAYGYYLGGNIMAKSIVSPVNIAGEVCFPEKIVLKVNLENVGTRIVDFQCILLHFIFILQELLINRNRK